MAPKYFLHPLGFKPWTLEGSYHQDQDVYYLSIPLGLSCTSMLRLFYVRCDIFRFLVWEKASDLFNKRPYLDHFFVGASLNTCVEF